MESSKCHLGAVIVRDNSIKVSNYRSNLTLDEYLKREGVSWGRWAAAARCSQQLLGGNGVGGAQQQQLLKLQIFLQWLLQVH